MTAPSDRDREMAVKFQMWGYALCKNDPSLSNAKVSELGRARLAEMLAQARAEGAREQLERDAKIADEYADNNAYSAQPQISGQHDGGRYIARAIRSQEDT